MDELVFFFAAFTFLLPTKTSAILFGVFLCMGFYLLIFRTKRSLAHLDEKYLLVTFVFAASSLIISWANGSLPDDYRWSSYPLYYLFAIPIVIGAVLVRDPLQKFVIGTRAALIVLAFWGLYDLAMGSWRPGLGSNPANAAFALTFLGVVSRLDVRSAQWLLCNRYIFFYLALIAVLASQTRALLPVFAAGLAFDIFKLLRKRTKVWRPTNARSIFISAVLLAFYLWSVSVIYPIYADRVYVTLAEVSQAIQHSDRQNLTGLSIRFSQWRAAMDVIAENPLLGRGGAGIAEAIAKYSSPEFNAILAQYKYTFVHNFILDEIIQRGLIGLVLLIGYFGFCLHRIYIYGDASVKENIILVLVLTLSFGLLHYLFVKDRHVMLYALYFLLLTTANHGWRTPRGPTASGHPEKPIDLNRH